MLAAILVASLLPLAACGPEPGGPAEDWPPTLIIAVDGLDWNLLLPAMREGRAPNLLDLARRGSAARLSTFEPTDSPIIWTSVATGKSPVNHGIVDFAKRSEDGSFALYDSTDRTTKALWNIVSDHAMKVHSVGWWMTYPVEGVNGVMVAQTNTEAQLETAAGKHVWKGTIVDGVPGQVWPP